MPDRQVSARRPIVRASAPPPAASLLTSMPPSASRANPRPVSNPSTMVAVGTPAPRSCCAWPSRAQIKTAADEVPSPTCVSTALTASTTALAAGWSTSSLRRKAPPCFVMVASPSMSMYTFSIPRGPSDVLRTSAARRAATRLYICDSRAPIRDKSGLKMSGYFNACSPSCALGAPGRPGAPRYAALAPAGPSSCRTAPPGPSPPPPPMSSSPPIPELIKPLLKCLRSSPAMTSSSGGT